MWTAEKQAGKTVTSSTREGLLFSLLMCQKRQRRKSLEDTPRNRKFSVASFSLGKIEKSNALRQIFQKKVFHNFYFNSFFNFFVFMSNFLTFIVNSISEHQKVLSHLWSWEKMENRIPWGKEICSKKVFFNFNFLSIFVLNFCHFHFKFFITFFYLF